MIRSFVLPPTLRAQIEGEARTVFPRECCGLIEGWRGADAIHAIALHPTRNLATDTGCFEIDPADHFAALRAARAHGRALIGCYHSHPNGVAAISERDRDGALDDSFVWMICAVAAEDVRIAAFIRENGRFDALDLRETGAA